jgi:biopolymer transport protein ExbD
LFQATLFEASLTLAQRRMRFESPSAAKPLPAVLPLLGVALVPAVLVLALVCFSLGGEEELTRLPAGTFARPPGVRETPKISVRITRQGGVIVAGEAIADADSAAVWQRERAALQPLGWRPSQAAVVIRADRDVPIERVQQLIEQAQAAGFQQCVLCAMETPPDSGERKP